MNHVIDFTTVSSMSAVDPRSWNRLVPKQYPFLSHSFLYHLEKSASVGSATTGWIPCHLLGTTAGELVVAMPLYQKSDSFGEYIFDWAWANAAHQAGIYYYPKLVAAVPFTPATGPRILLDPSLDRGQTASMLASALEVTATRLGASGIHILFCEKDEAELLQPFGFFPRISHQFHWQRDPHWSSFDDYLQSLRSANRKQIRKERLRAASHGLKFSFQSASDLSTTDLEAVYSFYRQTIWEKGAQAYLTRDFFESLGQIRTDCRVAMAHRDRTPVAAALYFKSQNTLFGRYWGASEKLDALHFELCYYQPIEYCILNRIDRFEAGAQGEHKLKRGLMPNACYSAHLLNHQGLHQAVKNAMAQESHFVQHYLREMKVHGPFQRASSSKSDESF